MTYVTTVYRSGELRVSFSVSARDWCKIETSAQWDALIAYLEELERTHDRPQPQEKKC